MFLKIASFWLCLAWQYNATGGRYNHCMEYVIGQLNENANLALFNIDSFTGWLEFIRTLPFIDAKDASFTTHLTNVIKSIKMHQIEQFFLVLIKQVLVRQLGFRQTVVN
jgi:hypothetical protein